MGQLAEDIKAIIEDVIEDVETRAPLIERIVARVEQDEAKNADPAATSDGANTAGPETPTESDLPPEDSPTDDTEAAPETPSQPSQPTV